MAAHDQTPAGRLKALAHNEVYLKAAEKGSIPEAEVRNWVLRGNMALPAQDDQDNDR